MDNGRRLFAGLAGILVFAGVALVWFPAAAPPVGAWFTGVVLIAFAFLLRLHPVARAVTLIGAGFTGMLIVEGGKELRAG